ncbi:MAG: hypothetical protein CSA75_01795, partial [Sorangium cellulosum]
MAALKLGSNAPRATHFGTCFRGTAPSLHGMLMLCLSVGCSVDDPPATTGGTDLQSGTCGRGVVVVNTDYQSTNVSLVSLTGDVLSSSFISSGSGATELSSPLGSDVTLPTQRQDGDKIVLLDRYPASVLTWVHVQSADVVGQLSVATGFASNPRDMLRLSDNKAYVTRYEPNLDSGHEPFDGGNDVLIVDPSARSITGRIDVQSAMAGEAEKYFARPDKMLWVRDRVYVLLGGYTGDFLSSAHSRVITIDPTSDEIVGVLELEGMRGC